MDSTQAEGQSIAVIGSGIAGLGAAWLLSRRHRVVVFEAEDRFGGHTHTHTIELAGSRHAIDTGFIVYNPRFYPLLSRMFSELGVASQPTTMSFALRNEISGLEYNASSLNGLFGQRRNLLRPAWWRMIRDILRFYREAPALLDGPGPGPTIGEYLREAGYGPLFASEHLLPMASALWSSPTAQVEDFPARHMVRFMANHCMLDAGERPLWQVVRGGSSRYLDRLLPAIRGELRKACPVRSVRRLAEGVEIVHDGGGERFDQVVFACHSDQALALLSDPTTAEQSVLGAVRYQRNDTVLHTDASLLPSRRRLWAAWNALTLTRPEGASAEPACTVSYCMNLLQGIDSPTPFVVTLNASSRIDPAKILARVEYYHPVFDHAAVAAQTRWSEVNGRCRSWYCGAWWGWGFHEDGLRSAQRVAEALGIAWG